MTKRTWTIVAVCVVALLYLTVAPTAQSTPQKNSKPIVGTVVNVGSAITGGGGEVKKDAAKDLISRGQLLGLRVGNGANAKIYLVYNDNGSYAGEKLASLANHPVGVVGEKHSKHGSNIIIATAIRSMR